MRMSDSVWEYEVRGGARSVQAFMAEGVRCTLFRSSCDSARFTCKEPDALGYVTPQTDNVQQQIGILQAKR